MSQESTKSAGEMAVAVADEQTEENGPSTCARVIKVVFSTAGLFLLNIVYLMIGASIFNGLEEHNEIKACAARADNYHQLENASLQLMTDVLKRVATSDILQQKGGSEVVRADYANILRQFSSGVLAAGHNVTHDCALLGKDGGPPLVWSWIGSLEFAMTVTTTIGYGRIAPKTTWGKVVCIVYAMLGIPIMILCLATVGEVMAKIFRYIYATYCCCGCCQKNEKKSQTSSGDSDDGSDEEDDDEDDDEDISVPLTISTVTLMMFTFFGAAVFSTMENWSVVNSTYFCFITFSTIGLGDLVPGMDGTATVNEAYVKLFVTGIYEVVGMAWLSMCFQLMQNEMIAKVKWLAHKLGINRKKSTAASDEEEEVDNSVKPFKSD